jgi:hypothetical protein
MFRKGSTDLIDGRRQAVEVAQAVLEDRLGICDGCRRLAGLAHGVVEDWRVDPDFVVVGAFASDSDRFPVGQVRKLWAPSALEVLDREREEVERRVAPAVMVACRSIVVRLSAAERCSVLGSTESSELGEREPGRR